MRFVEWYLDIPRAGPGEGTVWEVRAGAPLSQTLPLWLVVLLAVVAVVAVVAIYVRDARSLSWMGRTGLIVLRLASLAVLLVMLVQVSLVITQTGLPVLAVLIDTSASMGLEDRYSEPPAASAAKRLSELAGPDAPSRLNLAKSLLTEQQGAFLKKLRESHRLQAYTFAGTAAPLELATESDDPVIAAVRHLQADGDATRPAVAVIQVLDDLRGNPPSAILVLTDGITTTGEEDRLVRAAEEARARSVPLIPIGFGSNEPVKDVQLSDVLAEEVVFVDDPLTFRMQVKAFGYRGQRATVTLRREGRPDVIEAVEIELDGRGEPVTVEVTDVPREEGDFEYKLDVGLLPGETNKENNSAIHRVSVRREQLKVLLAERLPRWEFRHLKPLLERDPAIQLHTVLQSADLRYADEDETALRRFPVSRDELLSYDVIILGDLDLEYLSSGAMDSLRAFVAERGGALILIAGRLHNPVDFTGTPLGELLPIEVSPSPKGDQAAAESTAFRASLTIEGRTRSALRLDDSNDENLRVWETLPPLYWLFDEGESKPGAQVLVEHPTRQNEAGPLPVIVSQRYGAGHVLFHATDELWRWRERVEDRYYGRYWLQMVRYLSRSKLRGGDQKMELVADRSVYQSGDPIELQLRVLDPEFRPNEGIILEVVIEGPRGQRDSVQLLPVPQAPLLYRGRISSMPVGAHRAWLATPVARAGGMQESGGEKRVVPSADFRVEAAAGELQDRAFQSAELVEAAEKSRGAYYPFWEANKFLENVPQGRVVPISTEMSLPLWNRWEALVLLVGLLTAEWVCRKRTGLI